MIRSILPEETFEDKNSEEKPLTDSYQVLRAENQNAYGTNWSTEWLLSEYVSNTDGVIGQLDGSIPLNNRTVFVNEANSAAGEPIKLTETKMDLPKPDGVIYLDKSARPIQWMVRELWDTLATPLSDGTIPKMPKSLFLNIDKGDWLRRLGLVETAIEGNEPGLIDINKIPRDMIERIRAVFVKDPETTEAHLEDVWSRPTIFSPVKDGDKERKQNIVVLDEVSSSGQTLSIAMQLLAAAIPEANFAGIHWARPPRVALNGGAEVDGQVQYRVEWVPVWYKPDIADGRGVSDAEPNWPETREREGYSVTRKSKLGRHVLSTPFHVPGQTVLTQDLLAENLREDIRQMKLDLESKKILYRPSTKRSVDSDEEFEILAKRLEKISGKNFDDWRYARDSIAPVRNH